MKKLFLVSALFVVAICFASGQAIAQSKWTGSVNLYYGSRTVDDDWSVSVEDLGYYEYEDVMLEVSSASEFGINADFGKKSWPVNIFIGIYMADGDDSWSETEDGLVVAGDFIYDATLTVGAKVEAEIREIRIGAKKSFAVTTLPKLFPYVAGGLVQVDADGTVSYSFDIEASEIDSSDSYGESDSADDSAMGFWIGAGVSYQIYRQFSLGAEFSYSSAEVSFKDVDIEAGGMHYGLFVGYHW